MNFAAPGWFFALPIVAAWYWAMLRTGAEGVPLPTFLALAELGRADRSRGTLRFLRAAALCLVIGALAGPRRLLMTSQQSAIDIMLALDISGSMTAQDLVPNRVTAAKRVLADFISRNGDQRIGLVVFKSQALTICPLTTATSAVANALKGVDLDTLQTDGTAIGDAIGVCLNRLAAPAKKAVSQVIVLLTDGENNSGTLSPLQAAGFARARGVKIDAIAVGRPGGAPVPVTNARGQQQYVRNPDGSLYLTTIDETTLKRIADVTGGMYFRAEDTAALQSAYRQIAGFTRSQVDRDQPLGRQDLSVYLLVPALCMLGLELVLGNGLWRTLKALPRGARA